MTFGGLRMLGPAACLSVASGGVAAQGLPPATTVEIVEGARSCIAATSDTSVNEAKLRADGWRPATMSSGGKPLQNGLTFYARNGLLLILNKDAKTPLCAFTARIASARDFSDLQSAMAKTYGNPVSDTGKGEEMFLTADHHILDFASTGSQERPAVRVAIGPVPQENK